MMLRPTVETSGLPSNGDRVARVGVVEMSASFSISYTAPIGVVKVAGELDLFCQGYLSWRLLDLDALDCRTLRLDLGEVTYIDAGCLQVIDEARRRVARRGGDLELTSTPLCFGLVSRLAGYDDLATQAEQLTRSGNTRSADDRTGHVDRRTSS